MIWGKEMYESYWNVILTSLSFPINPPSILNLQGMGFESSVSRQVDLSPYLPLSLSTDKLSQAPKNTFA